MIFRRSLLVYGPALGVAAKFAPAFAKTAHHNDGHKLLGDRINHNGKHEIGKAGTATVVADVSNKKVMNMTAGALPVKKVRSAKQMASRDLLFHTVADRDGMRLAQAGTMWYAYCFDDGIDQYCYWYPAVDVVVTDGWVDYLPA